MAVKADTLKVARSTCASVTLYSGQLLLSSTVACAVSAALEVRGATAKITPRMEVRTAGRHAESSAATVLHCVHVMELRPPACTVCSALSSGSCAAKAHLPLTVCREGAVSGMHFKTK